MPDIQINICYGNGKWVANIEELRDTGPVLTFKTADESWDLVMFLVSEYLLNQTRFAGCLE